MHNLTKQDGEHLKIFISEEIMKLMKEYSSFLDVYLTSHPTPTTHT